jgi:peptidoglycan hydrolase-like protein with peptidoglycan-binding domain
VHATASPVTESAESTATAEAAPQLSGAPAITRMLALQRTIGNRAVAQMLARQAVEAPAAPPAETTTAHPELRQGAKDANYGYSPHRGHPDEPTRISDPTGGGDVELLQLKLNWHLSAMRRLGLIVDGDFGGATARAVIAFKRFHNMRPANAVVDAATWTALDQTPQIVPPRGRHALGARPEYDRITEDGLLQITLAVGFDEHGLTAAEHHELERGLTEVRGFTLDPDRAAELHEEAGRPPPAEGGELFVKENVATSLGSPVHCVLRLIGPTAPGADGTASATAAALALDESEIFEYGGHARYGTGPDFDRNYTIRVHWDQVPSHQRGSHTGDQDMGSDEFMHAFNVGDNRRGITTFERMREAGQLTFIAHPEGNLGINPGPVTHPDTLGNHLIGLATAGQPLRLSPAVSEDHYRLWLFNGCVTREYMNALRTSGNTQMSTHQLDVTTNVVPPYVITLAEGLLAYLDGVLAQEGARALVDRMENAHPRSDDRYGSDGFQDNGPGLRQAP